MKLLALADDLTGALEVGALFGSVVVTRRGSGDGESLVIDTETRHLPAGQARDVVAEWLGNVRDCQPQLIYKKTDSTLRGNIGAELDAITEAYPGKPIVYAPAYPRLGRTVRNGILLVDGVPVNQTAFAADRLDPVTDSRIAHVIARHSRFAVRAGPGDLAAGAVHVFDGESDSDVAAAARIVLESGAIAAGPGALAAALASPRPAPEWPEAGRCLIVNGSRHETSRSQIEWALDNGFASGPWRVWQPPKIESKGLAYAAERGVALRGVAGDFDAVMIFGGDTAFGFLAAIGHPPVYPIGEIVTGVPVSRVAYGGRMLHLITKAGGFGSCDLIGRLHQLLGPKETE